MMKRFVLGTSLMAVMGCGPLQKRIHDELDDVRRRYDPTEEFTAQGASVIDISEELAPRAEALFQQMAAWGRLPVHAELQFYAVDHEVMEAQGILGLCAGRGSPFRNPRKIFLSAQVVAALRADITRDAFDMAPSTADAEDIFAHELGHCAYNLNHATSDASLMYGRRIALASRKYRLPADLRLAEALHLLKPRIVAAYEVPISAEGMAVFLNPERRRYTLACEMPPEVPSRDVRWYFVSGETQSFSLAGSVPSHIIIHMREAREQYFVRHEEGRTVGCQEIEYPGFHSIFNTDF